MKNFAKKLDYLFWWVLWLMPLITAFICLAFGSDSSLSDFISIINTFRFDFIADLFTDLQSLVHFNFPGILVSYLSYLVSIEILHVIVDVILFIPRLAHSWMDVDNLSFGGKR